MNGVYALYKEKHTGEKKDHQHKTMPKTCQNDVFCKYANLEKGYIQMQLYSIECFS